MIKIDKRTKKDGTPRTQVRVVEGYRPGPGLPTRQRTIKDFGCLEDQEDPEKFMLEVKAFNESYRAENSPLRIEAPGTAKMDSEENRKYNYGYRFLEAVYDLLEIDAFFKNHAAASKFRGQYCPAAIFKFLVFLRILQPDSKRASFQLKEGFYGMPVNFSLPDIYRCLDLFYKFSKELERHLNERVKKVVGRDLLHIFFDVTNFYFEIDFPAGEDDLRKKGVSKEHRTDPIVALGLFMDERGLPVSMSVFPGNTAESLTLKPMLTELKEAYGLSRLVVVADKGINTSRNIDLLTSNGDGFVFSQILRGKKGKRYQEKLFEEKGWTQNSDGSYRYKLFTEEYTGLDSLGNKEKRLRKVLLYWSKAEAEIAKRKRAEKLKRAARAVKNNAYGIKKGAEEYTKEMIVDKKTGDFLENAKKLRQVDLEKAEQDQIFDGYFCLVTSELDYSERKMRAVYSGLWRIEESFQLLKTNLDTRPVFVRTNEHISAHFLICFVALLIIRIIQHKMGEKALSAERIARALKACTCQVFKGGIVLLHQVGGAVCFKKIPDKKGKLVDTLAYSNEDEISQDYKLLQDTFGASGNNMYFRQEEFNRFLKSIVF